MVQALVGVDTGKARHQAAAYDPAAEQIVGQVGFGVDRAGFDRFRRFLEQLGPQPDQMVVGVEATGHYHLTLVEYLVGLGYQVALLNPFQAAQFRRSQGKRAKTDRLDAQALARFLAVRAPRPRPAPSQTLVELRELTRFRAELVDHRTTVLHRLIGGVDLAFPELPHLLSDLRGRTALTLLAEYPTASESMAQDRTLRILVKFGLSGWGLTGRLGRCWMNRWRSVRRQCQSNSSRPTRSRRTAGTSGRRRLNNCLATSTWMTLTSSCSTSGVVYTTNSGSPSS